MVYHSSRYDYRNADVHINSINFHLLMLSWDKFIKSKYASWLLAAVLVLVGLMSGRMYLEKRQVDSEIEKLQSTANEVKRENEDLAGLIKYWNTSEFQEKEAREKLNLKKEGEIVVVLPEQRETVSGETLESEQPNISKWFNYFFKGDN